METRTLDAMVVLLVLVPSQLLTRVMIGPALVASHMMKPQPQHCSTKWMKTTAGRVAPTSITTDVILDVPPTMQTSKAVLL
jgi:hypothetical protein